MSVDPIVHTEFFAAKVFKRRIEFVFNNILALGRWIPLTAETCTTASRWLAPMDKAQRRAHFADALIAAVAGVEGATLLTHDGIMASLFPISVQVY